MIGLKMFFLWSCVVALGLLGLKADAGESMRVEEFPVGKQTDLWTSAILSGFELGNSAEKVYAYPHDKVWVAVKTASERLAKVGKRDIVSVDEKTGRIQNGKISQDAALGMSTGAWLDEIFTEVVPVSQNETKVVVYRRVVQVILKRQRGGYERQWRTAQSNGQIENWVLTQIEDQLVAMPTRPNESGSIAPKAGVKAGDEAESKLQRLLELKEKKLITEEEYQTLRKKALDDLVAPPSPK